MSKKSKKVSKPKAKKEPKAPKAKTGERSRQGSTGEHSPNAAVIRDGKIRVLDPRTLAAELLNTGKPVKIADILARYEAEGMAMTHSATSAIIRQWLAKGIISRQFDDQKGAGRSSFSYTLVA